MPSATKYCTLFKMLNYLRIHSIFKTLKSLRGALDVTKTVESSGKAGMCAKIAGKADKFAETAGKVQKELNVANKGVRTVERPSWRQSELDVGELQPEYNAQKSFIDGNEVPYGTKGSSRPDFYKSRSSLEVKIIT